MQADAQAGEPLFLEIQRPSEAVVRIVSLLMMAIFILAFALVPVSPWLTLGLGLMALVFWWWIRATCLLTEVRPIVFPNIPTSRDDCPTQIARNARTDCKRKVSPSLAISQPS
ncbi:MAG: hypothetical protein QF524_07030, partial [Planctomycetota bacterium]|nr:hypothetical protein [Planctomycetota bacterium]